MTTTINLETLLPWSDARRVETKNGPRILRKAAPSAAFRAAWGSSKAGLKAAGIGWSQELKTGEWQVCWWQPLPAAEQEQAAATVAASKAMDADVEIPRPEGLEYLPFQRAGISFACGKPGVLIADDMGLGKTIQAIGVINSDPLIHRVLIVCPASLKLNWKRELEKWLVRPQTVGIASGEYCPKTDIVIVNYDILWKFRKAGEFFWDLIVADECHLIKNPSSKRSQALCGKRATKADIAAGKSSTSGIPAKRKLALTGTPILNRPMEIFPILNWLDPVAWPNGFKFGIRYAGGERTRWGWEFKGATHLDELQHNLRSSLMIRRLKSEVLLELPAKRRQVIELAANGSAGLVDMERAVWDRNKERLEQLKARVELARVSDSQEEYATAAAELKAGAVAAFADGAKIAHEIALAKVPDVIEHLTESLEAGKIVCFAHHLDVIGLIAAAFPGCGVITGDVTLEDRQKAVDRFQNDAACRLIVCGIKAAGVGLTLTASSHVVFAEIDWVPGTMSQCEDRTHRIGQRESVLVQLLVLERSLDAHKVKTLVAKQQIIDRALDQVPDASVAEPVVPVTCVTITVAEAKQEAAAMTRDQADAVHLGLRMLAGVCDGAVKRDGCGFNGADAFIGRTLANQARLSGKQAALGRKLLWKYARQLPEGFLEQIGGTNWRNKL